MTTTLQRAGRALCYFFIGSFVAGGIYALWHEVDPLVAASAPVVVLLCGIMAELSAIREALENKQPAPMPELKPAPVTERPIIVPKDPIKPNIPADPTFDAALAEVTKH
jgi:hypothetical protein